MRNPKLIPELKIPSLFIRKVLSIPRIVACIICKVPAEIVVHISKKIVNIFDFDGNPQNKGNEARPHPPTGTTPKRIASVNRVFSVNCNDLPYLPQRMHRHQPGGA